MILIIGYGNLLRGDDAVGRRVVEVLIALRESLTAACLSPNGLEVTEGRPAQPGHHGEYSVDSTELNPAERALLCANLEILSLHQLGPELAESISQSQGVVFVDARHGPNAGSVQRETVAVGLPSRSLTHILSPSVLLSYAKHLYGHCPPATVVSVESECFSLGTEPSVSVQQALSAAVHAVLDVIREWKTLSRSYSIPSAIQRGGEIVTLPQKREFFSRHR
jgi:hydrogenase maturation protease